MLAVLLCQTQRFPRALKAGLSCAVAWFSVSATSFAIAQVLLQQGSPLYSCTAGTRTANVFRQGDKLVYTFGPPQHPEIRIIGDPKTGTVSYLHSMYPHAEHQQLRFRNGIYSYVLYARSATPNVITRTGGEDSSGLLIFKGARRIARVNCVGDGWPIDETFGKLPDDGDDITPDPSER